MQDEEMQFNSNSDWENSLSENYFNEDLQCHFESSVQDDIEMKDALKIFKVLQRANQR